MKFPLDYQNVIDHKHSYYFMVLFIVFSITLNIYIASTQCKEINQQLDSEVVPIRALGAIIFHIELIDLHRGRYPLLSNPIYCLLSTEKYRLGRFQIAVARSAVIRR